MNKPETGKDWSDVVKGAKRELLLRAARDEFAEQGLEGATMRSIALRAGYTTGAIYPLFDSKETIYAELLKQSLAALDARVAGAASTAPTPKAQVEAACSAFLNYYLDHRFEIKSRPLCLPRPQASWRRQTLGRRAQSGALDSAGTHRHAIERSPRPQAIRSPSLGSAAHQPDDRALVLQIAGQLDFLQHRRADVAPHDAGAMPCRARPRERRERFTQNKTLGSKPNGRIEKNGAVWTVVHSRFAEARNAMDPESADALVGGLHEFDADDAARVAVLWGEGGAFCAGWDLKFASTLTDRKAFQRRCRR